MKIPLDWLKDFVNLKIRPEELAEKLTMSGLEVGAIEYHGKDIDGIVVGKVKSAERLISDRHLVCRIDTGKTVLQVITDDLTIKIGEKIPIALEGSRIAGNITISKTQLHGVEAFGYLCKPHELGLYEENYVLRLPKDAVPGEDVRKYTGSGGCVLDIDILPNRGDCQSVLGVAREVSAVLNTKLKRNKIKTGTAPPHKKLPVAVEIKEKALCPRYMAKVLTGISVKESPDWLKDRLLLAGMRPINNVVDVTNYLLLELGQPMHAFDADLILGGRIIVRTAAHGEKLITLDGMERKLDKGTLVIADNERAVALAGVMGGANTEVSMSTRNIILESAYFDPVAVSKSSKSAKLRTEASIRFEKGVDWAMVAEAVEKAAAMIAELSGGEVVPGTADVKKIEKKPKRIELRRERIRRILGEDIKIKEACRTLNKLGFRKIRSDMKKAVIEAPLYRAHDVQREIDLIEEIARVRGYDKIRTTRARIPASEAAIEPLSGLKDKIRQILVGCGMMEAVTFSLVDPKMAVPGAARLSNPMTEEESVLRTAIVPSLLKALSHNLRHQVKDVQIFEVGKIFLPGSNKEVQEKWVAGGVAAGRGAGIFDIKGIMENLLNSFTTDWTLESLIDRDFYPGKSAAILIGRDKKLLGKFGALHPDVTGRWDIREDVYAFELDLEVLSGILKTGNKYRPLPKFPKVERDLAMFVPEGVSSAAITSIIREQAEELFENVFLFDRYKESQAYRISFRLMDRTLTDEEVSQKFNSIQEKLTSKLKVRIRK